MVECIFFCRVVVGIVKKIAGSFRFEMLEMLQLSVSEIQIEIN